MKLEVIVCLPREARTISLVRGLVGSALERLYVASDCVDDIRLAISEACTNVIEHAAADDDYEVRLEVNDENCEIRVINARPGFDSAALEGVLPDAGSVRGRGVALMHAVMDQVDFVSEPEVGTVVHLVKELSFEGAGLYARSLATTEGAQAE